MKRSSLQWKLTLWFSAALVLMAVLTFILFIATIVQVICFNSCSK